MLNFFRKYQKIFFGFMVAILVISFVFYGTYQAFGPRGLNTGGEEEGSYQEQMVRFLDTEQWMISRKIFAANILNDGVISRDFLESGMAEVLATLYSDRFEKDWIEKQEKEKSYLPYTHPYLPSLSASTLWSIFAPELPAKLAALQDGGGFRERVNLFLAQKDFPPAFFSQMIRYQEQNNPQMPRDHKLAKDDIALFGYQSLSDWLGTPFVETVAEVIIEGAERARKQGFRVKKEEVLTELVMQCHEVYKGLKQKIDLPVQDGNGLFQLYLRQVGMREETALKIWEDVTLFRRLFHAVGDAALVDPMALTDFYAFAFENAQVEMVHIPENVRLRSDEDLKLLETYLAAVATPRPTLEIPPHYAPIELIEQKVPELVGKRYTVEYAEVSESSLQARVSVKETQQWQCLPENWEVLKRQFPELAQQTGEPFDILEKLEAKGRKKIDIFASKEIVRQHPEWIEEALLNAAMKEKRLFLGTKTEKPFEGISDPAALAALFDQNETVLRYTQGSGYTYRFHVKERSSTKEVLPYREAKQLGLLEKVSRKLGGEALLQAVIAATPPPYKEKAYAYRFARFLQNSQNRGVEGALEEQFKPEKLQKTVTRSENFCISLDEALALQDKGWSPLKVDANEGPFYYRFLEKHVDTTPPLDKIVKSQELLSQEARCRYLESWFKNA